MPEEIDSEIPAIANFDSDYDYKPLEKSLLQRAEEKMFKIMSGGFLKRNKKPSPIPVIVEEPVPVDEDLFEETPQVDEQKPKEIVVPASNIRLEKSLFQRLTEKLHFPPISKVVTNGLALAVFAAGSYLMYSELPTHPELVIGFIMVSVAGNVIISGR